MLLHLADEVWIELEETESSLLWPASEALERSRVLLSGRCQGAHVAGPPVWLTPPTPSSAHPAGEVEVAAVLRVEELPS